MKTWRIDADRDDPRTRAIALGGGSERKNAALLRAMPAYAQTMTGGVAKRLVPRRPALLLALLASASNQTLLAALTVGSLNAGLLASASAETCVTGVNTTFANAINDVSGQPGGTVVTGVTPTTAPAVNGVATGAVPFLTSATLHQATGTAVASVTAPTTPITAIDASSTATTPFNPNLRTIAVDASIANNAPPAAKFAFNSSGATTTNNSGSIVFTNTSNPGLVGPLLTVPFLNGSTVTTPVVTSVTSTPGTFLTRTYLKIAKRSRSAINVG